MTSVDKKVKHDRQSIRNHVLEIIEKRRKDGNDVHGKDFLQFFLDSEDNKGQPLSDDLLIDNMLTFTTAGRDTTAHALTWMFYLIYRDDSDKNIQTTLVREVDDVLGGSIPTYETFKNLKFAEACFYEVPRNLRYCVKEDILPDGTKVYAGEWVAWSSYVMGRSESVWGPDAKEFRPSRWINSVKPSLGKFNSFGLGPRACPGQHHATIQVLTVIGMILQHFDVKLEEPSKVPTYATSLAFPMIDGLKIRVSRRQL
ncbi:Protein kinase alk2 [Podila horticola]|nr:Protein kinase alk2 [Podila horticola]